MAEYKTYICDICKKHEAKRFTFPCVDHEPILRTTHVVGGSNPSSAVSRTGTPR